MPPDGRRAKADTGKRAGLPRRADFTRHFVKDWDRLDRTARYDMHQLKRVMLLLISNDGPLPAEWKDHALKGDWADHRECHVGGDFLLVYTLDEKANQVVFTRAGTHAELFE